LKAESNSGKKIRPRKYLPPTLEAGFRARYDNNRTCFEVLDWRPERYIQTDFSDGSLRVIR
jgi:hypothetical protein